MEFKEGIFANISMAEYRVIPALNKSAMTSIDISSFHYHNALKAKRKKISRALAIGSALDMKLFEPELYSKNVKIHKWKTPKEFIVNKEQVLYLHEDDMAMIDSMHRSIFQNPLTSKIFQSGLSQTTLLWMDSETGIHCKARPDWICEDLELMVDLKTCPLASYNKFRRDAKRFRYDIQALWYLEGWQRLTGKKFTFAFACMEKIAPYSKKQIAVYSLPDPEIEAARQEIEPIKEKYKLYVNGDREGYPCTIQSLYL